MTLLLLAANTFIIQKTNFQNRFMIPRITTSFVYVIDWINEHPFKNSPNASLICNLMTGAPVKPEAMWTMMNQLKNRIITMLKQGAIENAQEKQKLHLHVHLPTKLFHLYKCFDVCSDDDVSS